MRPRFNSITSERLPEMYQIKKKIYKMQASLHRMLYTAQMMRTLMLDLLDLA